MGVYRRSSGLLLLLGFFLLATTLQGVQGEAESEGPSESECRPFIEKALKELETGEPTTGSSETGESEDVPTVEVTDADDSQHQDGEGDNESIEGQGTVESVEETVALPETSRVKRSEEAASKEESSEDKRDIETSSDDHETGESKSDEKETESKESETEAVEQESDKGSQEEPEEGAAESGEEDSQASVEADQAGEPEESKEGSEEEAQKEDSKEDEAADEQESKEDDIADVDSKEGGEDDEKDSKEVGETVDEPESKEDLTADQTESEEDQVVDEAESKEDEAEEKTEADSVDDADEAKVDAEHGDSEEGDEKVSTEEQGEKEGEAVEESAEDEEDSEKEGKASEEDTTAQEGDSTPDESEEEPKTEPDTQDQTEASEEDQKESGEDEDKPVAESKEDQEDTKEGSEEDLKDETQSKEESTENAEENKDTEPESVEEVSATEAKDDDSNETKEEQAEESSESELKEGIEELVDVTEDDDKKEDSKEENTSKEDSQPSEGTESAEKQEDKDEGEDSSEGDEESAKESEEKSGETDETVPVEDLTLDVELPTNLRSRDHVEQLLKLDDQSKDKEAIINSVSEITLKELKRLYENAIKPLEVLYKYRDLSNRHFGDAEIFSKPLILFMGPWSGGKSSIINYLANNEYNDTSLRTGAEPSPAYFNILMHGDQPEVLDGTQLAADFTFSGLQKFGQGLEERLRGLKLPIKLLEKVNIVEIPGILEVRKQMSRLFPFNDACQWFIDRADIIFLVYDPSKLDVGPETEAILDQLKGREHQTRIVLNKADQVKPEELLRVQGALIWNISPLMSSPQPPVMYTASLWSRPYESWAPVRLLQAQERAFLRDLRGAIEKRIEHKIASARRFAVRVRNHAKMVDCYLTTYYNHKSVFGNRKQVADEIIDHPQDYHIYEGLSTLTNISRYDLPDPDVYREFFRLNPLYEFQQLSATCTYFRGCPINKLDVAIAYDLPELVGIHKKRVESALAGAESQSTSAPGS